MVARARDPPPPPSLTVVDTTNTTQPPLLPFVVHDSLHPLLITYVAYIPLPITLRKRPSRASPLRLVLKTACEVIGEEVRMSPETLSCVLRRYNAPPPRWTGF